MARIAGVNLPLQQAGRDRPHLHLRDPAHVQQAALGSTGITPDTYVRDLTEEEVGKLRDVIDRSSRSRATCGASAGRTSSASRRSAATAACATAAGLPVRGQKTKTNARTRKGPRRTQVAGKKKAGKK